MEHRVFQWLIAWYLGKLGYEAKKEYTIQNKRLDVFAQKDVYKIGIEVCISPKINFHATAEVAEKLDEFIIVCKYVLTYELMQKNLAENGVKNANIRLEIGYRYLTELRSQLEKASAVKGTKNSDSNAN